MEYRPLGETGKEVSLLCLGTMTFGQQNSQKEAHEQLDYAFEQGINFIDTAEMYPVPPRPETFSQTEFILGKWGKLKSKRDQIILATKATGRSEKMDWIRGGPRLNEEHLTQALEGSLKRLGVDCIDLYQLHWPERKANYFGQRGFSQLSSDDEIPLAETLSVLKKFVEQGKIRWVGLSNETPWGVMECLKLAREIGLPRVQSIQNPYNLLNRLYEVGLSEISLRERVGLLAYSPLAFGMLSGKYLEGARPEKARLTLFPDYKRYQSEQAQKATERYARLAKDFFLPPAQLALNFIVSRPFVTSAIIGATTLEQLKENIACLDFAMNEDLIEEINAITEEFPNPSP